MFRLFLSILLLALGFAGIEWLSRHPQALPWTRLALTDPIGLFTPMKIRRLRGEAGTCHALLNAAGRPYTRVPPLRLGTACAVHDGVRPGPDASFAYAPVPTLSCPLAASLFVWRTQIVEPAAQHYFNRRLTRIETLGSYSCRRIESRRAGAYSEHATANAIDIAAFQLADGRRISVAADWTGGDTNAAFLHAVRRGACRIFATTLSPDYDAAHHDHLHLDQAQRGGAFCR